MASSIKDVAKRAGVSPATVSRIMNQSAKVSSEKAEAVREAMAYYHYQPNHFGRALVKQRSNMIGVSLAVYRKDTSVSSLDTLYTLELLKGVEQALVNTDYDIVLVNNTQKLTEGTPFAYWNLLQQHRIDGLILSGLDRELEKQMEQAQKDGPLPIAYMGRQRNAAGANIYAQYEIYTRDMLKRIYAAGHRKVILYHSPHHSAAVSQICRDVKSCCPGLCVQTRYHCAEENGYLEQLAGDLEQYVKRENYTAICGISTENAGCLLRACRRLGISVPRQLSAVLTEYKLGQGEELTPEMSAYYVPAREMGAAAARAVMELIEGRKAESPAAREFVPQYRERGSLVPPDTK